MRLTPDERALLMIVAASGSPKLSVAIGHPPRSDEYTAASRVITGIRERTNTNMYGLGASWSAIAHKLLMLDNTPEGNDASEP